MAKQKQEIPRRFMQAGDIVYVRSARNDYVGRIVEVCGPYSVLLEDASWVANSGYLTEFMRDGLAQNMEIEIVGVVCVQWLDWSFWPHRLFTEPVR